MYRRTGPDRETAKAFWKEIAPSEHIAHFYTVDWDLMNTLTGCLREGLNSGESAIVIATLEHLRNVCRLLPEAGVDMQRALREDRFITLDAHVALSSFMVDDRPDEQLFRLFVGGLIRRATRHGQKVRVFGEMVALLWAQGNYAATVQLEHMWARLSRIHTFPVLNSYPKTGFTNDESGQSISEIRAVRSKVA